MSFNIQDNDIRNLIKPLQWCPTGFKYLGVEIRRSTEKIFVDNHIKLLDQVKLDLQKWRDLPLSLIGRVNVIKMTILPKFLYLFHCVPIRTPKSLFKEINKTITSFLWKNKIPRVKLSTLQAPYAKGGLNLPNFRNYYLAAQFRSIWCWLHAKDTETKWLHMEQHLIKNVSLKVLPFLASKKALSAITKNPIFLNSFSAWYEAHTMIGLNISLLRHTPLWDNPNIPHEIADRTLKQWVNNGIKTVKDLYTEDNFFIFQELAKKFNLPNNNLFKYFQIRHWVHNSYTDFPKIPPESPLEEHLFSKSLHNTKGLISSIYTILNNNLPAYDKISIKSKWESDLNYNYDDDDWSNLLKSSQTVFNSANHRQIQFNIFNRTYYTPLKLHKIHHNTSSFCQRCKIYDGDLLHMLWNCSHLEEFWKYIAKISSDIIKHKIPLNPRIWILGDIQALNVSYTKKYFILLASTAGKKCILQNWKAEIPPSHRQWLNELASYSTPEKILYNVRKKPATYQKIWGSFMELLPVLHLHKQ